VSAVLRSRVLFVPPSARPAVAPARVAFVGSRSCPPSWPAVDAVVASVLSAGRLVGVGCCVGADVLALRAALAAAPSPSSVAVFAAFGPGGEGAGEWSAVDAVAVARRLGASLVWWAGGPASLSFRARCAARSAALVRWAAEGGPGSGLVAFVSSPSSRGSFRACRLAVAAGLPVVLFPFGWARRRPLFRVPALGPRFPGVWVPCRSRSPVWSSALVWRPGLPSSPAPAGEGALMGRTPQAIVSQKKHAPQRNTPNLTRSNNYCMIRYIVVC